MKKINPLFAIIFVSFFIAIFQIGLVSQKLNQYGVSYPITQILPWGIYAQQWTEDSKITLKNYLLATDSTNKEATISQAEISPPLNNFPHQLIVEADKQLIVKPNVQTIVSLAKNKCHENCIVLTIGDSVMGDVYYSLSRKLKKYHPDWKIIDAHKVSSGLSNQIYYNWPKVTQQLIEKLKPDYVIMLIGMNDAQGISDESKAARFNTEQWNKTYEQRTQAIFDIMSHNSTPIWIELPEVKLNVFNKKLDSVRSIHQSVAGNEYFSVSNIIGNNKSLNFDKFRQIDGIHLNALGSDIIAEHICQKFLN